MTVNTAMLGRDLRLPFLGKCDLSFLGLTLLKFPKDFPLQAIRSQYFVIGRLRLLDKVRRLLLRFTAMLLMFADRLVRTPRRLIRN